MYGSDGPDQSPDEGLVLEGAPTNLDRPSWLLLVVVVAFALVIGAATGYAVRGAAAASPQPQVSVESLGLTFGTVTVAAAPVLGFVSMQRFLMPLSPEPDALLDPPKPKCGVI